MIVVQCYDARTHLGGCLHGADLRAPKAALIDSGALPRGGTFVKAFEAWTFNGTGTRARAGGCCGSLTPRRISGGLLPRPLDEHLCDVLP
jgi:hypothetical protein